MLWIKAIIASFD
uniref:Uncharacterized protein n=1 Tax=Rhizophora mucronata TaxID=61149 RepID=A0A2P2J0C2_RHIMU